MLVTRQTERTVLRVQWARINQRNGRTNAFHVPKEVSQKQTSQQVWMTAMVSKYLYVFILTCMVQASIETMAYTNHICSYGYTNNI